VQVAFDVMAGYNLRDDDAVDAIRGLRAALHGFVTLESGATSGCRWTSIAVSSASSPVLRQRSKPGAMTLPSRLKSDGVTQARTRFNDADVPPPAPEVVRDQATAPHATVRAQLDQASIGEGRDHRRSPERCEAACSRAAFDYTDGAAEGEIGLRRARRMFQTLEFSPSVLHDVSAPDTSTTVLGRPTAAPFAFAPTGFTRLMHHEGERAVVRVAERYGIAYALSTMATTSIETWRPPARQRGNGFSSTCGRTALPARADVARTGGRVRSAHADRRRSGRGGIAYAMFATGSRYRRPSPSRRSPTSRRTPRGGANLLTTAPLSSHRSTGGTAPSLS